MDMERLNTVETNGGNKYHANDGADMYAFNGPSDFVFIYLLFTSHLPSSASWSTLSLLLFALSNQRGRWRCEMPTSSRALYMIHEVKKKTKTLVSEIPTCTTPSRHRYVSFLFFSFPSKSLSRYSLASEKKQKLWQD